VDLIDISVSLSKDLPIWPDSPGFDLKPLQRIRRGADANISELQCDVHTGTHIDAPLHFVQDGSAVDNISLESTIGPATVKKVPEGVKTVTSKTLEALNISDDVTRLLLRTSNSSLWEEDHSEFRSDYTALAPDAANWIVDNDIRCIGVDYLSVQHYDDGPETHQILLEDEVIIIEGLNLSGVTEGKYELLCMPLKVAGAEGAPARVALRRKKT
jgi:arylformamidase